VAKLIAIVLVGSLAVACSYEEERVVAPASTPPVTTR
jgi:hypothetical protein